MKKIFIGVVVALTFNTVHAQFGYYQDALLFSQHDYALGSTARIKGISGTQVALGGDVSTILSNPAGLGVFNRNTLSVTPSLELTTIDTDYLGETTNSFFGSFSFPNIGFVFQSKEPKNKKFRRGSFGFSLSKVSNFKSKRIYEGANDHNSIVDAWANNSQNFDSDGLSGFALDAYDLYLTEPVFDENGNITRYVVNFEGFPIQSERINEYKSNYKLNIAWGGNYDDIVYFGGGLGINIINYRRQTNFLERDFIFVDSVGNNTSDPAMNSVELKDNLNIEGGGINLNFGVIVRPIDFVRVGLSYTSPTVSSFDEMSDYSLQADWREGTEYTDDVTGDVTDLSSLDPIDNVSISKYTLLSPGILNAGLVVFIKKRGFISSDISYKDYSNARISSNDFSEADDNGVINSIYQSVLNWRVGGELKLKSFALRAGYSYTDSPYILSPIQQQESASFGIGYSTSKYTFDVAVIKTFTKQSHLPYEINNDQPIAISDINKTEIAFTVGLNF